MGGRGQRDQVPLANKAPNYTSMAAHHLGSLKALLKVVGLVGSELA